jgi:AraC-like DNA-binding protein
LQCLKVNIFSVEDLLTYQDEAFVVYKTENEEFSIKKLTTGEWALSYTEKYLSKRDNHSEVTRDLSIYYDGENYKFSGFYVSCNEKDYFSLGDEESILKAWTGEFTEEKLNSAIKEYKTNYKNIIFREGAWQVSFSIGFQTSSCVVVRTSIVDENNAEFELNEGALDFYPDVDVNINKVAYLPIYTAKELPENCSIISYLTDLRIENAKDLLRRREYSISAVAEKTGFASVHYFSSVFKNHTGMTPRQYIEQEKFYE